MSFKCILRSITLACCAAVVVASCKDALRDNGDSDTKGVRAYEQRVGPDLGVYFEVMHLRDAKSGKHLGVCGYVFRETSPFNFFGEPEFDRLQREYLRLHTEIAEEEGQLDPDAPKRYVATRRGRRASPALALELKKKRTVSLVEKYLKSKFEFLQNPKRVELIYSHKTPKTIAGVSAAMEEGALYREEINAVVPMIEASTALAAGVAVKAAAAYAVGAAVAGSVIVVVGAPITVPVAAVAAVGTIAVQTAIVFFASAGLGEVQKAASAEQMISPSDLSSLLNPFMTPEISPSRLKRMLFNFDRSESSQVKGTCPSYAEAVQSIPVSSSDFEKFYNPDK